MLAQFFASEIKIMEYNDISFALHLASLATLRSLSKPASSPSTPKVTIPLKLVNSSDSPDSNLLSPTKNIPRELKFHRSIMPPPPAPNSGDGNGGVRPQRGSFPARMEERQHGWEQWWRLPPQRPCLLADCDGRWSQERINTLALNELFVREHNSG